MRTAIAAPESGRPLYVFLLEEVVRELDRVIAENGPTIRADYPEDHGISREIAATVASLRDGRVEL